MGSPLPRFYHTAGCQRGRSGPTVNRLHHATQVRILHPPLHTTRTGGFYAPERAPSTTKENHHARHAALAPIPQQPSSHRFRRGRRRLRRPRNGRPGRHRRGHRLEGEVRGAARPLAQMGAARQGQQQGRRGTATVQGLAAVRSREGRQTHQGTRSRQRRLRGGTTAERVEGAGLQGDRRARLAAARRHARGHDREREGHRPVRAPQAQGHAPTRARPPTARPPTPTNAHGPTDLFSNL